VDLIERWFGLAPDGGNGLFEAGLALAALALAAAAGWYAGVRGRRGVGRDRG
jgi:hypothetical protein